MAPRGHEQSIVPCGCSAHATVSYIRYGRAGFPDAMSLLNAFGRRLGPLALTGVNLATASASTLGLASSIDIAGINSQIASINSEIADEGPHYRS